MRHQALALFVAAVITTACVAAQENPAPAEGYKVLRKEVLGGEGGWDYLTIDPDAHRLYISRDSRVMVVDTETFKVVKEIPGTNGVHGIALAQELNRGFTSNGRDNSITIFDLKTLEKIGEAKSAPKPDAIVYDPQTRRVFVSNNGGKTSTAIDAAKGEVVGSIELGGAPEFAVFDGQGHMYVNLEDTNEVVQADTSKLTVTKRWPVAPAKTPTGLALDVAHRRLFSGCRGGQLLQVLDADTGKIVASLPIGGGVDAVAFDPETQTVFSSNGDGTLTVIHEDTPDKYHVVQNVTTQNGAKTMALNLKTHQVWLVAAEVKMEPVAGQKPRRTIVPNTFSVLVVGK